MRDSSSKGDHVSVDEHDAVTVGDARSPAPDVAQDRPATLNDRYVMIESLGQGGMGVVVRAYDPKLRREVALKRVAAHPLDEVSQARLVREAQAMARLSHPNVVAVHDVQVEGSIVTVVMEYVSGETLEDWLARFPREPRPWREILAVFVAAGGGLAAAHAVGLVHRDFKPSNVLLTLEGDQPVQVKVTDFGLVKEVGCEDAASSGTHSAGVTKPMEQLHGDVTLALTTTGSVVGTPRYMAPEQHAGAEVDGRADQYALCVGLWEALTGEALYAGFDLARHKTWGPRSWPKATAVPAKVVAAIERGLAPEPQARWPSVDALLEALQHGGEGRRKTWRRAATVAAVVAGGAALLGVQLSQPKLCTAAATKLAEVWNDQKRTEVEVALLATDVAYASAAGRQARRVLDEYGRGWVEQHTEACQATSVRGDQSAAVMDLRMACLHRAKEDLRAVVEILRIADAQVMQKVGELVGGLPDLRRCSHADALARDDDEPDDPEVAARVDEVRTELAAVKALQLAGKYPDAYERLQPLEERTSALGYAPVQAEVRYWLGTVLDGLGRYQEAATELRAALAIALEHGQPRMAARAANQLAYQYGERLQVFERADEMAAISLALARKLEDAELEANVRSNVGGTRYRQGRYKEAEEQFRQALAIRQAVLGEDHRSVATSHNNIANALYGQGKYAEAEAKHRRALALKQEALGEDHPEVATSHGNLGSALYDQGKYKEAEGEFRRALTIKRKVLGEDHPSVAISRSNLGNALNSQGKYKESEEEHRRALAIEQKALGEDHPDVALSRNNLGNALERQGKYREAEQEHRRALAIRQRVLGAHHPQVASSHNNLGNALERQGRHKEAEDEHRQALAIKQEALGEDHPSAAISHRNLAETLAKQNRFAEALLHFERAWTISERADGPPEQRADNAFALADLLRKLGQDRPRALELAAKARDVYRHAGDPYAGAVKNVERWLQEHGSGASSRPYLRRKSTRTSGTKRLVVRETGWAPEEHGPRDHVAPTGHGSRHDR